MVARAGSEVGIYTFGRRSTAPRINPLPLSPNKRPSHISPTFPRLRLLSRPIEHADFLFPGAFDRSKNNNAFDFVSKSALLLFRASSKRRIVIFQAYACAPLLDQFSGKLDSVDAFQCTASSVAAAGLHLGHCYYYLQKTNLGLSSPSSSISSSLMFAILPSRSPRCRFLFSSAKYHHMK